MCLTYAKIGKREPKNIYRNYQHIYLRGGRLGSGKMKLEWKVLIYF